MADIKKRRAAFRPSKRRLIQLYAALLYNANLKGFIQGKIYTGNAKALCVPGLNCYSCPGAIGACPLGALQNALAASGKRAGWYILGILLLFGLTLGRTVCGWLCPMGMAQELLHKIPTPKIGKSRITRALSWLKYGVLIVFAGAVPLWYALRYDLPVPGFCKYICPAGTLEGAVGLLANPGNDSLFSMLGLYFTRKYVILVLITLACVFCYRAFCRFLCPLGAIYGLFNRIALTGMRVDAGKCSGCGACVRFCEIDVRRVGDRECVQCGRCVHVCGQGAISMVCGNRPLIAPGKAPSKRARRAVWAAALAVLAAALIWFNLLSPAASDTPRAGDGAASVGYAVGERLPDFSVDTLGGGSFRLADAVGKPVFINLWATYCGPCVKELPYFDRLLREHPEARVLAVHSGLVTDDVAEYLADKGWSLDFAVDDEDGSFFALVGGSPTLPQTVVLNTRGEVIYNLAGSVTYEKLLGLLEEAER